MPVTKNAALAPPPQLDPGPGERKRLNAEGQVVAREEYLVDEQGRVWRHGMEWEYWSDGSLRAERSFAWDEPDGTWRTYWQNGDLRSEHELVPGERTPMVYWHPNGQKASEGQAIAGRREGPWTYWYADGQVGSAGAYREGRRHGPWREYFVDGSWKSYGHYELGDKTGSWWYGHPGQHTGEDAPTGDPSSTP